MEPPFIDLPGVVSVTAGYTGGSKVDPSYEQVSAGSTGHAESIEIVFDPAKLSYAKLLDVYWHNVDPTVKDRQFCDGGNQYRTAIFYHSPEQQQAAEASKAALEKDPRFAGKAIYTQVAAAGPFYAAEGYHQHYFRTNPTAYKFYRWNCGRDQRLAAIWGSAPKH
jgi:peptide-methionine (S)-S-oxide reductase